MRSSVLMTFFALHFSACSSGDSFLLINRFALLKGLFFGRIRGASLRRLARRLWRPRGLGLRLLLRPARGPGHGCCALTLALLAFGICGQTFTALLGCRFLALWRGFLFYFAQLFRPAAFTLQVAERYLLALEISLLRVMRIARLA